jgi:hypothetical protein
MKKRNRTVEKASLPQALEKHLAVYALAAGAAGVSALALAPSAQASIITYTTPTTIGHNTSLFIPTIDLSFRNSSLRGPSTVSGTLFARELNGGFVSSPLAKGAPIDRGLAFKTSAALASGVFNTRLGTGASGKPWANKSGYLGFEFFNSNGSKSYFGWLHMDVTANAKSGITAVISDLAYDTVPGQEILAGQTSQPSPTPEPGSFTLSLLALGAAGLFVLRKRKLAAR